ncbi:MAG: oxidoreductase, partial [Acidobacteriota bacterium]|nr:oxidoreductase [Acidobacteriota bacterium]
MHAEASHVRHVIPAVLILAALAAHSPQRIAAAQQWESLRSGTDARLRGLSAVSDKVAWASGARGTVLRTVDGGRVWQALTIPETADLDFRDIDAMSERVAYVLSIGNGPASRIYKTIDGGQTWTLQFQNADADAFFDAMAFWDDQRGIAISDSVGGRFVIIRTIDGGATWSPVPASALPPAL